MAGHGTMGLEILEDCPDVRTVICAIGGGGLITGVGSAVKAKRPEAKVLGAEPETAAPYALSLREGGPRKYTKWEASLVDGAGGKSVTERMWQRMRPVTDGAITVTLDQTREAMRLIAEKSRTIAEGAGALALAAALSDPSLERPIVCVVSGGNIDLDKFAELVTD
jgi:threonine dehydratase